MEDLPEKNHSQRHHDTSNANGVRLWLVENMLVNM